MPFKRILSAVDFSPDSVEGFRIAVEMSSVPSASLHLLHVIEARPTVPVDAASEIVEEANAAIDRLVAACGLFPNRQSSLLKSPTANRSMRSSAARAWRADLIVLGAKGVASLGSIILGGTAEHVMREAPCSVLTVRRR